MGPWTKRLTRLSLVACVAALPLSRQSELAAQTPPAPAPASKAPVVTAVRGVEVVVSDLSRSRAFFELLGFTAVREEELSGAAEEQRTGIAKARVRRLELALGSERLALRQFIAPAAGRPVPLDSRGNDLWFQHVAIVVRDMEQAYGWLRAHHVAHVSSGPQTLPRWNKNAAGIQADVSSIGAQPLDDTKGKHACKGQNACKGQGGCKTDKHACKGQNACKGQGGCKG